MTNNNQESKINFHLSKTKHRELKLKAFSQGLTISDVLRNFVDEYTKIKVPRASFKKIIYGK